MKTFKKQINFLNGEVNQKLSERVDIGILESSCKYIKNFYTTTFGSIKSRFGTRVLTRLTKQTQAVSNPIIQTFIGAQTNFLVASNWVSNIIGNVKNIFRFDMQKDYLNKIVIENIFIEPNKALEFVVSVYSPFPFVFEKVNGRVYFRLNSIAIENPGVNCKGNFAITFSINNIMEGEIVPTASVVTQDGSVTSINITNRGKFYDEERLHYTITPIANHELDDDPNFHNYQELRTLSNVFIDAPFSSLEQNEIRAVFIDGNRTSTIDNPNVLPSITPVWEVETITPPQPEPPLPPIPSYNVYHLLGITVNNGGSFTTLFQENEDDEAPQTVINSIIFQYKVGNNWVNFSNIRTFETKTRDESMAEDLQISVNFEPLNESSYYKLIEIIVSENLGYIGMNPDNIVIFNTTSSAQLYFIMEAPVVRAIIGNEPNNNYSRITGFEILDGGKMFASFENSGNNKQLNELLRDNCTILSPSAATLELQIIGYKNGVIHEDAIFTIDATEADKIIYFNDGYQYFYIHVRTNGYVNNRIRLRRFGFDVEKRTFTAYKGGNTNYLLNNNESEFRTDKLNNYTGDILRTEFDTPPKFLNISGLRIARRKLPTFKYWCQFSHYQTTRHPRFYYRKRSTVDVKFQGFGIPYRGQNLPSNVTKSPTVIRGVFARMNKYPACQYTTNEKGEVYTYKITDDGYYQLKDTSWKHNSKGPMSPHPDHVGSNPSWDDVYQASFWAPTDQWVDFKVLEPDGSVFNMNINFTFHLMGRFNEFDDYQLIREFTLNHNNGGTENNKPIVPDDSTPLNINYNNSQTQYKDFMLKRVDDLNEEIYFAIKNIYGTDENDQTIDGIKIIPFQYNDESFLIILSAGIIFFKKGANDVSNAYIDLDFTIDNISYVNYSQYNNYLILTHKSFKPKQILYKNGIFSVSDFVMNNIPLSLFTYEQRVKLSNSLRWTYNDLEGTLTSNASVSQPERINYFDGDSGLQGR
ncbi:MAG: hypothetical protein LBC92_00325, partial [Rickettsiales bacterium]|nr:hypothetical protein [Rickettsiales bacterium]